MTRIGEASSFSDCGLGICQACPLQGQQGKGAASLQPLTGGCTLDLRLPISMPLSQPTAAYTMSLVKSPPFSNHRASFLRHLASFPSRENGKLCPQIHLVVCSICCKQVNLPLSSLPFWGVESCGFSCPHKASSCPGAKGHLLRDCLHQ